MLINVPADMFALIFQYEKIDELTEESCRLQVEKYIELLTACHPKVILLNVNYRRSFIKSEVMSTPLYDVEIDANGNPIMDENGVSIKHFTPVPEETNNKYGDVVNKYVDAMKITHRHLLERNIDIFDMAVSAIKRAGCEVWFSLRMSDHHVFDGLSTEFIDENCFAKSPVDAGRVDFSLRPVQTYFKHYIQELVSNYDIDGIELDWLRTMPILPADKRKDYTILSEYLKELHNVVSSSGPNKHLAIRVLPEISGSLGNGMDVARWIADGSVDRVTLENFYIPTNFEISIDEWRNAIQEKNVNGNAYELYCGTDNGVSCTDRFYHYMTPELIRGFASTHIGRGADDIYLFNMCELTGAPTEMFSEKEGKKVGCVGERLRAATQLDNGCRRYIYVRGKDNRYPMKLNPGEKKEIKIYTGKVSSEYAVFIGSDEARDLKITMNNSELSKLEQIKSYKDYEYKEERPKWIPLYYRGEFDKSMRRCKMTSETVVLDGYNTFVLKNIDSKPIEISWIEVEVN